MSNRLILFGLDLSVVACVAIDTLRHRRLHPAFSWGALAVLGALHVAFHLTTTPTWVAFGRRMVS